MTKLRTLSLLAAFSTALMLVHADARADAANAAAGHWAQQVSAISAGDDTAARAAAITRQLDALGIPWRSEAFTLDGKTGNNLVADLGGKADAPLLLIGAHYDRVQVGRGATDNASGSATVLALAEALHANPLQNHRVQVAFWDLEEAGLLGSRAWVTTEGREKPALYVNFDVFGWGDTLWMMTPLADAPLATLMAAHSKAAALGFSAGDKYPPTDHLAFLAEGWPAVSFSLVGGDEIESILAVFGGQKPASVPKVMQVIHSPRDTDAELDPSNVPRAVKVLDAGLREWDAQAAGSNQAQGTER
jgi:Zn-dependent M28 family amino/carboxypeptidase